MLIGVSAPPRQKSPTSERHQHQPEHQQDRRQKDCEPMKPAPYLLICRSHSPTLHNPAQLACLVASQISWHDRERRAELVK